MKYIVYMTTNFESKVNNTNKIYIGVHKTNDPNIFDGYIGCGVYINKASTYMYPKTPFQYAVKKYGIKAFKRQTLFIFDNAKEAYEKEKDIINTEFIKQSKDGKMTIEFPSITSCAQFLKCQPQSISKAIKTQSLIKNYYVSKSLVDEFKPKERVQLKDKMIYIYDINGNFIGQGIGKEIMNIISLHSYKSIWSAIYSNCGWYKDYYLSLEKIEKVPEKLHNRHKKVDVYDKFGNLIETLESLKLVKEKYNLNSAELKRILKGIKKHEKYIFQYSK